MSKEEQLKRLAQMGRPSVSNLRDKPINREDPNFYPDKPSTSGVSIPTGDEIEQYQNRERLKGMSALEKDKMNSRIKDLEPTVAAGMLTKDEMWPVRQSDGKTDNDQLQINARKQAKRDSDPEYQAKVRELKSLRKLRDPDDPSAGRLEYLRRQGEADKLARWV